MLKLLFLSIVLLYLFIASYAYFAADRQIFFPPRGTYTKDDLPVELVRTSDGIRIAVLHLNNSDARYTILFSHGNAEDLGGLGSTMAAFSERGYSVLAYDYRGYGASEGGPPTAEGAYRDIAAVYRHATEDLGIPASRLILYGRSVGSGPSVFLAATEPVGGLIVEGGFTSAFRVVTRVSIFPFDRFPNLRRIGDVGCPVLIVHGVRDEIISISHGRKLFEAAPDPKRALWVEDAGHNDLAWRAGPSYWHALDEFRKLLEGG